MLRYDVTTNDWVIFSPARAMRPEEFGRRETHSLLAAPAGYRCPFCPGNEDLASQEIAAIRDGGPTNGAGWKVRVIPNAYPALRIEEDHRRLEEGRLFRQMGGCGAHEVIIDSPDHNIVPASMSVDQLSLILRVMRDRFNDLMRDPRFQSIVIFKNYGPTAGTSLSHPHSQLIATPVTPRTVRQKLAIAQQYFDETGDCLYCALLSDELADGKRVLAQNSHFAAILPYASHVPFETWILPRHRQSSFRWMDPSLLHPLAEILKTVLLKLHVGLGGPDFNLTIITAPRGDEDSESFMWFIEILPRLATPAGFELGSGMSINTMLPEEAADFLRGVDISKAAQAACS
jgi:UDPglucose--hexose-1-phosphate uridylyltransferase